MFTKSKTDIERTLALMVETAKVEARYNEEKALKVAAGFIRNDKRFEQYDADHVAREAFECKRSGRQLELSKPAYINNHIPPYYHG